MTPLTPTDIEHIADVIADTFPLCASQLREHAGTMRSVSEVTEHRMAEQRVWTKGIDDCHCVNCGLTWDMHLADGRTSCPPPREDAMRAFNDLALAYGLRQGRERADALRWFMLGRNSVVKVSDE